jgi:hypothetical protein
MITGCREEQRTAEDFGDASKQDTDMVKKSSVRVKIRS